MSFYVEQVSLLSSQIKKEGIGYIRISLVDNQGKENDIILLNWFKSYIKYKIGLLKISIEFVYHLQEKN